MQLTINGISYFVARQQKDSQKPDLLLLHGFMGSGQSFEPVLPQLEEFVNPVTIDLLGHRKTEGAQTAERFNVGRQIMDIKQIISEIFDTEPFLHGYSMGGRLALRYTLTFPQTIRGLIIESTNYGLDDPQALQKRKQTDEKRASEIETDYSSFVRDWQNLPLFQNKNTKSAKNPDFYQSIQEQQDPKQMANSLRGFGTGQMKSVKESLSKLTCPVLVLAGQADSKYKKIGREMNDLFQQSSFKIIENASHRVHQDQPKAFVSVIKTFIRNYG